MERRLQEEIAQEEFAEREQQALNIESEWDAANARVEAEIMAKAAEKAAREEAFLRKQQCRK